MPQSELEHIKSLLAAASVEICDAVFAELRQTRVIHPLEKQWGTTAEFILEAIARSQDITKRGIRGIIAELAFSVYVMKPMRPRWREHELSGELPYDSLIEDEKGKITIQTKNQRLVKSEPLYANATMVKRYPDVSGWFIAETQRTRSGRSKKKREAPTDAGQLTDDEGQQSTRPYRFGNFDILAVCLHPSTNDWRSFLYTPARTLIASAKDSSLISTFQAVPAVPRFAWTDDLETCIEWVRNPECCPAPQASVAPVSRPKELKKKAKKGKAKKQVQRKKK